MLLLWFSHHALLIIRFSCRYKWWNRCSFSDWEPVLITSPSESEIVRGEEVTPMRATDLDPARKLTGPMCEKTNSRNSRLELRETSSPSCVSVRRHFWSSISVRSLLRSRDAHAKSWVGLQEEGRHRKRRTPSAALLHQILVFIIRPALERGLMWGSGVATVGFRG